MEPCFFFFLRQLLQKFCTGILRGNQRSIIIHTNPPIGKLIYLNEMETNQDKQTHRRTRTCRLCKQPGHDRRNCVLKSSNIGDSTAITCEPRNTATAPPADIDFESCVYCVLDLETTGFSRFSNSIIEICAVLVDSNGVIANKEVATFSTLVKPIEKITPVITEITGISNEMVETAPYFQEMSKDFIRCLQDNCRANSSIGDNSDVGNVVVNGDDESDDSNESIGMPPLLRDIVLVAHNGNRFDIPFLFKQFELHGVDLLGIPFKGKIDTLLLAKFVIRNNLDRNRAPPENYQLGTLYKYVTGLDFD